MNRLLWIVAGIAVVIVAAVALGLSSVLMPGKGSEPDLTARYSGMVAPEKLLRVPVTGIYPGGNPRGLNPDMENPLKNDPDAVARGMKDFDNFNCSGCHMANGGGGMGPALSNRKWVYRSSPANIYLSIAQGRGAGMPAFGAMLPDRTIWELVAYIQSISQAPVEGFGTTTSANPETRPIEQVPAGQTKAPDPWNYTEAVPPNGQKNGVGSEPPDAPLPPGAEQAPQAQTVVPY